jgi:hypothetical protein
MVSPILPLAFPIDFSQRYLFQVQKIQSPGARLVGTKAHIKFKKS